MKQVYRNDLIKAISIYRDALNQKFQTSINSPATLELMFREIESLRKRFGTGEKNPVWEIQIKIVPSGPRDFELKPDLEDFELVDVPTRNVVYTRNNH